MAKIPPYILPNALDNHDYLIEEEYMINHHTDWTNFDDHPWQWYMEVSIRKSEGWFHIKVNPMYKHAAVIHWLNEQEAVYRTSQLEFLIKDPQVATMASLKWT